MKSRCGVFVFGALAASLAMVQVGFAAEQPARAAASSTSGAAGAAPLNERLQEAKRDLVQFKRDLQLLEEDLLYPASSQVAVFVSLDVGKAFKLDSVQVKLDDKVVANYLYSASELAALQRGGVQRLYLGNLTAGEHELVATLTGTSPSDASYKRTVTQRFDKAADAKFIQLRIEDAGAKMQPGFNVKVWQ
ncbi:AraC family transcriptional regulator [Aquabacterium sp.]|uniref:AraC family transcriptional regulator n=1 Tax=Aquabacterium sp. TaxID=1872578 RepID=UPI002E3605C7|nr:AraC family transcriptional regulator [Aquabacterium sp.]HEX5311823.1 AraC family transcriptional regulator [Aquabacterium sp.]